MGALHVNPWMLLGGDLSGTLPNPRVRSIPASLLLSVSNIPPLPYANLAARYLTLDDAQLVPLARKLWFDPKYFNVVDAGPGRFLFVSQPTPSPSVVPDDAGLINAVLDFLPHPIQPDRLSGTAPITVTQQLGAKLLALSTPLAIAYGGTNSATALSNNQLMRSTTGAVVEAGAQTNGQIPIGSTGAAPVMAAITQGTNITITNAAGAITLDVATGAGGVTAVTGTAPIASSGGATPAISLNDTAVVAASYTNTSLTVDAKGRLTAASSGTAPVTSVTGTSPIASSGGTTPAISLNDTAVVAASYTNTSLTVDAKGRLTAASSGTAPVTAVTGTAPIASSGGTTPAISLNDTAVVAGSYTNSSITVDAKGRLTAASSGAAGSEAAANTVLRSERFS